MTEGGEFKYDIFDILKGFCKCHNAPPAQLKKRKRNEHFSKNSSDRIKGRKLFWSYWI
jgi:hypothetical protein